MQKRALIQGMFGGTVEQTGERSLTASYPHRFITVLLMFPVVLFTIGAVLMVVGAILNGALRMLLPAVMGLVFAGVLFAIARQRSRTMGDFRLDVAADSFQRLSGDRPIDTWTLSNIVEIRSRWDFLHRGFERAYWLTVRVDDGRVLRVGKGSANELNVTLQLLASWGLPVRT